MPFDPENTTGIQMPPRGGNPMLKDDDLLRIVGYLRTFEGLGGERSSGGASDEEEEFWIPRSVIPPAAAGPPGLNLAVLNGKSPVEQEKPRVHHAFDPDRPANAQLFFGVYFLMTGLHGIHVFAGMLLIAYLLIRSMRGHFGSRYFTPVDLGGLYWHVVDVIWIFLFPLLYLIR
ncbi:MAG: cytochrome c oxidase subunit 3 [Planctomycetes bacterium]|nr:cytochrome c oxidase subunit 3 [Planctomycetota bacterium]